MAPLNSELRKHNQLETFIYITSQHQQMLDQVLEVFQITPDFDLKVMRNHQMITEITIRVLQGMEQVLEQLNPDLVLVHGDTTTTFSVSLAAAYRKIRLGHATFQIWAFECMHHTGSTPNILYTSSR